MDENPFGNRLVHVWSKEPVKGGMLENARVQHVGGREFIVGELLTKDSRNGLTMWMAMEDVLALVEYPDRASADAVSADFKKRQRRKGWLWR